MAVYWAKLTKSGKISAPMVWIVSVILLILSGIGYRVLASRLKLVVETPIVLPVPLNAFPKQIGAWSGEDVPIPDNIQRVAQNDDFLNRLYMNKSNGHWVSIYIAYTARPRNMLGHQPQVCYVAGGWIHDSTESSEIISGSGTKIPCLIHRFHRSSPGYEERIVLNFYILNGQLTADESGFSGVGWRTPNIKGNAAHYVTQVQVSSVLEASIRTATKDVTDLLLDFFPDENGKVRTREYTNTASSVLK